MRFPLVQNSTSLRFGKKIKYLLKCEFIQLLRPMIQLVRINSTPKNFMN